MKLISQSLADSDRIAYSLAKAMPAKFCLSLDGNLGAGKTTFVSALTKALAVEEDVSSPTFTILQMYEGENRKIYHFDVYRLEKAEAFWDLGLEEYFEEEAICLVEWASLIEEAMPEEYLSLGIEHKDSAPVIDFSAFWTGDGSFQEEAKALTLSEDDRKRIFHFEAHGQETKKLIEDWLKDTAFPRDLLIEETDSM